MLKVPIRPILPIRHKSRPILPILINKRKKKAVFSCRLITLPIPPPLKHPSHSLKYICFLINSKLLTLQLDYETYETTI